MRTNALVTMLAFAVVSGACSSTSNNAGDEDASVAEDTGTDASTPARDSAVAADAGIDSGNFQNTDSGAADATTPIDAASGDGGGVTDASSDAAPFTYLWEQGANGMCPSPPMMLTGTVAQGQACSAAIDCAPTCCMCGGALTNTFLAVECSAGLCVDGCAIAQSNADCTK